MTIVRGLTGVVCACLWMACGGSTVGSIEQLDGGMSGTCGGQTCAFGQRCAHTTCGAPDSEGTCRDVPLDCLEPPGTWIPVCDCEGNVHPFGCGEFDTAPSSRCTVFPCGASQCKIATEYCERQVSDIGGVPDSYVCKPMPGACVGAPSCPCIRSEPCGASCQGSGSLGLLVTCPGG